MIKTFSKGFLDGSVVKNPLGLIPGMEDPTYCGTTKSVHHNH